MNKFIAAFAVAASLIPTAHAINFDRGDIDELHSEYWKSSPMVPSTIPGKKAEKPQEKKKSQEELDAEKFVKILDKMQKGELISLAEKGFALEFLDKQMTPEAVAQQRKEIRANIKKHGVVDEETGEVILPPNAPDAKVNQLAEFVLDITQAMFEDLREAISQVKTRDVAI
jgi:hypothetical protein